MQTYIITEKQNAASKREGYKFSAKNLSAAKRHATKNQSSYGTVLTIETESGTWLATKQGGKWTG